MPVFRSAPKARSWKLLFAPSLLALGSASFAQMAGFAWLSACSILGAGGHAAAQDQEREKLVAEIAALSKSIADQEAALATFMKGAKPELEALRAAANQTKLSAALATVVEAERSALNGDNRSDVEGKIRAEAIRIITEVIGPTLAQLFGEPLSSALTDLAAKGPVDVPAALKVTMEEVFGTEPVDAVIETSLKPTYSKALTEALAKKQVLEDRLKDLDRREARRKAGIPFGMEEIPGGNIRMGVDESEIKALGAHLGYRTQMEAMIYVYLAYPAHNMQVQPFYLDQNEVTCRWYLAYLESHPSAEVPKFWRDGKCPDIWLDRPVTGISYNQAVAFARWMGRRLPTEFEWESAARAGQIKSQEKFYWTWGDKWDPRAIRCNFDGAVGHAARSAAPEGFPPLTPVGTFPESKTAIGIQDLLGNANEFTSSPFVPYKGFKRVEISKRVISEADFNEELVVIRGGDFSKKDVLVSTFNRYGYPPTAKSDFIGFRTAVSKVKGADLFAYLEDDADIRGWQVDYYPLPSDGLKGRKGATIHLSDPAWFSCLQQGGFDEEKQLPSAAKYVAIASRETDETWNVNLLRQIAKGAPDERLVLGYLKLDFPSVEPALPAGNYFLVWQNSVKKPEEPDPAAEPAGQKPKPGQPKKVPMLPEALIIEQRGAQNPVSVRIESFPPPIVSAAIPTKVTADPEKDMVELTYSFPVKYQDRKTFSVTVRLKLEPGVAATLR